MDAKKDLQFLRKELDELKEMNIKKSSPNYDIWKSTIYLTKSCVHKIKFYQQLQRENEQEKGFVKKA